jgi:protein-disulfide isomerase
VGGAQRAERKRKRQAMQAAAGTTGAKGTTGAMTGAPRKVSRGGATGVAVVALLALVVGFGIWLQQRSEPGALPPTIPVAAAGPTYPVSVQGDAVAIGNPEAPVTIDVYEDFLCPACAQFEQLYGDQMEQAAAAGQAQVIYHPVAILDGYSEPAGYSTLAAGATFCAADAGIFPRFHRSLYAAQPREGGPGWSAAQLEQLGRTLGAGDDFTRCLRTMDEQRVVAATENARQYVSTLRPDGRLGTPTVLVNGSITDTGEPSWLDETLGAAR